MKHPNKEEPEALGKAEVVRVNNQNHSMTKLSLRRKMKERKEKSGRKKKETGGNEKKRES